MDKMLDIEMLLPHDAPMILVDKLVRVDLNSVHCQVNINRQHLFFDSYTNSVPAYVGIELMAQSIAAWSGYQALEKGQPPPIGFLLGSRRYQVYCAGFLPGQTLDIYAEKLMEDNGMAVFTASLQLHNKKMVQAQINVYVPTYEKLKEMKNRSSA